MRTTIVVLLFALLFMIAGCGGSSSSTTTSGTPINTGNWSMTFTDASSNKFQLSALFSQNGSVVTGANVLGVGNVPPFSCIPFSATFGNGQVVTNQFSGDFTTPFGNVHFTSALNAQGTHAAGTYTLTGSCWGVAASGTFSADEIPSITGTWNGTISCTANCPAGATTGTISLTLTQDNANVAVSGTYSVTGLPNITSGTVSTGPGDPGEILAGAYWQDNLHDANGNTYVIAGGPGNFTPGLGLDRSFKGLLNELHDAHAANLASYSVSVTH